MISKDIPNCFAFIAFQLLNIALTNCSFSFLSATSFDSDEAKHIFRHIYLPLSWCNDSYWCELIPIPAFLPRISYTIWFFFQRPAIFTRRRHNKTPFQLVTLGKWQKMIISFIRQKFRLYRFCEYVKCSVCLKAMTDTINQHMQIIVAGNINS